MGAATFSPYVAEIYAAVGDLEAAVKERDAANVVAKQRQETVNECKAKLIALGVGNYQDEQSRPATVVAGSPGRKLPDTFHFPPKSIPELQVLAGDFWSKLRAVERVYRPKEGFEGRVLTLLPRQAAHIFAITRVPGPIVGARDPYVRLS